MLSLLDADDNLLPLPHETGASCENVTLFTGEELAAGAGAGAGAAASDEVVLLSVGDLKLMDVLRVKYEPASENSLTRASTRIVLSGVTDPATCLVLPSNSPLAIAGAAELAAAASKSGAVAGAKTVIVANYKSIYRITIAPADLKHSYTPANPKVMHKVLIAGSGGGGRTYALHKTSFADGIGKAARYVFVLCVVCCTSPLSTFKSVVLIDV